MRPVRVRAPWRPPLRSSLLLAGLAAAALLPLSAQAAVYKANGCQVTVPDGWVTSRTRVASPDKKLWASLLQAGSAAEVVQIDTSLQATKVSEDERIILMVSTAAFGGLTNRQYHAITKTAPSCAADVTSPAGPEEATARQIALTVGVAK